MVRPAVPIAVQARSNAIVYAAHEAPGTCGNGFREAGEACDDGADNGSGSSCCAPTCAFEPDGPGSCDGNACTRPDTCTGGVCMPGTCADAQTCGICGGVCNDAGTSYDCVF